MFKTSRFRRVGGQIALLAGLLSLVSASAAGGDFAQQTASSCTIAPPSGYSQTISGTVDGDVLELTIAARYAGAVSSLTWRGKEFINTWDHGREISYAWGMNGYGECLNPTEPGTARDYQNPGSTSRLLSACQLAENTLTTTTQPAFWLAPGEQGFCAGGATLAVNETLLSDHILHKTIQIGYAGMENVIAFTAVIIMPSAYASVSLEAPTAYLTHEFSAHYRFDPASGELVQPESEPLSAPWSFVSTGLLPPILATEDGAYAMGAYTFGPVRDMPTFATNPANDRDRTNKWSIVYYEEPVAPGPYVYQSFVVIGTLEQVQETMAALYQLHPLDTNPPTGYVDEANCDFIAGWAWDPKTPNEPIEIQFYDLSPSGARRFVASTLANQPRPDLPPVLGDNGRHGYRLDTPIELRDGFSHELFAEAVNSDVRLPNRDLFGSGVEVNCPAASAQEVQAATAGAGQSSAPASAEAEISPEETASTENAQAPSFPCFGGGIPAAMLLALSRRRKLLR